jgi:hypothetical protein
VSATGMLRQIGIEALAIGRDIEARQRVSRRRLP